MQLEFLFGSASRTTIDGNLSRGHRHVRHDAHEYLAERLTSMLGETVKLTVTDNRRTMIASRRGENLREVRIHRMFLTADDATLDALAGFLKRRSRRTDRILDAFIEENRTQIRSAPHRAQKLITQGTHFNLRPMFDDLNRNFFKNEIDASITWGTARGRERSSRRKRRRSIKLGTYSWDEKLIRIHPTLDQEFVPQFFVEYIVFHEMLHHAIPPKIVGNRRMAHCSEFQARERAFPHYARSLAWEKEHVNRLLVIR